MKVITQQTPNPNALKFIVDKDLLIDGKITITTKEECLHVPLASCLFDLEGVHQLYFFKIRSLSPNQKKLLGMI